MLANARPSPELNGRARSADVHLQRVLRGIASGADPGRLLHQVVVGAVDAGRGRHGVLVGVVDGTSLPLAATPDVPASAVAAADAAVTTGRLARRSNGERASAVAEPIRAGTRVVGALAVSGELRQLEPGGLALFADCASIVLSRRAVTPTVGAAELLDALSRAALEQDHASVLERLFEAAEALFAAQAGFAATVEGSTARILFARRIDRGRLARAVGRAEVRALLAAPVLQVERPDSAVAAALAGGLETVVALPLRAGGSSAGCLVLLLGESPDAARRAMLEAFARHAGALLHTAWLRRELRASRDQVATVVQSMLSPVLVADERGDFALVNSAAAELFHLSETFEVGQPVRGRLGNVPLEELLTGERHGSLEVALGTDGLRVYRAVARTVRGAEGRSLGRVLVLDDLTRQREIEQIKEDFLAVIGHELRTPLTIVRGAVRTLERRGAAIEEPARARAVDALGRNVDRLERLIEDLLFVAAVERGQASLRIEQDDIGELVALLAGDRIVVRRPRRPLAAAFDAAKIGHVLFHLVDNALKYSEEQVFIDVIEREGEVEVAVTDSGPGIFSGDIPRLFERFRQLDGSGTRAQGGTGLGLYIARRIIEAHGGRIWCESRLGVGSRFAFSLPKDAPAA